MLVFSTNHVYIIDHARPPNLPGSLHVGIYLIIHIYIIYLPWLLKTQAINSPYLGGNLGLFGNFGFGARLGFGAIAGLGL